MSDTGKSTALAKLEQRGFDVVDTDEGGWSEWSDTDGGYVWRGRNQVDATQPSTWWSSS
jgi:hypothetical protein